MLHIWMRKLPASLLAVVLAFLGGSVALATDDEDAGDNSAASKTDLTVPDGSPDELLEFIQKIHAAAEPQGTRKERMEWLKKSRRAIIEAADQIRSSDAGDKTVMTAVKAELDALTLLKRLGDKQAGEKFTKLTAELKSDRRPQVAALLTLIDLSQRVEQASDGDELKELAGEVKQFLSQAELEMELGLLARNVAIKLFNAGEKDEASQYCGDFAKLFVRNDKVDLLAVAAALAQFTQKMYSAQDRPKDEAKFDREFAALLKKSELENARQLATSFEAQARRMELPGNTMEISGKLVDGDQFDLSHFKGKVVLVDFWATWCGPCVAELPNVKRMYKAYHDRGFEVVGISLDQSREDLEDFIAKEKLPWPVLYEGGGEETSGWKHPLATYYGVNAIPLAILLNREGKVINMQARGEALGELLSDLLGPAEEDEK